MGKLTDPSLAGLCFAAISLIPITRTFVLAVAPDDEESFGDWGAYFSISLFKAKVFSSTSVTICIFPNIIILLYSVVEAHGLCLPGMIDLASSISKHMFGLDVIFSIFRPSKRYENIFYIYCIQN